MSRGGARAGAGRKPTPGRVLSLRGGRERAGVSRPSTAPALTLVDQPAVLSAAEAAVWLDLAAHAIQARTLTAGMVPAFLRLCRAVVKHAEMERQIEKDGLTYLKVTIDGAGQEHTEIKAHPLIARAEAVDTKIRGWFKDFAINPFGKPIAEPKEDVDEWATYAPGRK